MSHSLLYASAGCSQPTIREFTVNSLSGKQYALPFAWENSLPGLALDFRLRPAFPSLIVVFKKLT
jgi:hypothetical protein